ncbi:MAG: putative toxin-antitoxin system toxin component, PIN family [Gammaproteobacteria bacterium]|nr:putative toxin-antitoxin system toxin component, PIN family [Gammaproteobacteria bacterium]
MPENSCFWTGTNEFRRVSRYPKLCRFLKPVEAGNLVNGLRHQATVLKTLRTLELSLDPADNPVLAMAEASQAQYLVMGDKMDLLALGKIGGTTLSRHWESDKRWTHWVAKCPFCKKTAA